MKPFTPSAHGTTQVSLDDTVQTVPVRPTHSANQKQIWVDNRGNSDVLIEFFSEPEDANSFRIMANAAQPLTIPANATTVYLKRPTGSAIATVYVSIGEGF